LRKEVAKGADLLSLLLCLLLSLMPQKKILSTSHERDSEVSDIAERRGEGWEWSTLPPHEEIRKNMKKERKRRRRKKCLSGGRLEDYQEKQYSDVMAGEGEGGGGGEY
jgi:hypothetical protein